MKSLRGIFLLGSNDYDLIYGSDERARISELVEIYAPPQTGDSVAKNPGVLADADVIFSGWGMPRADESLLAAAPNLQAIFYGAGAIGSWATQDLFDRGVIVTTAQQANSVPVAEYTLATILFSLKHGWRLARETREARKFVGRDKAPGCYRRTVGLISLGVVARMVLELLRPFDLEVIVHDPFISEEQARRLGVESVSLADLFRRCHVTSLHTPSLPETEGMITGEHFAAMPWGATFVNTARGVIVRQDDLIDIAMQRPDLEFVLDVAETPDRVTPEWPEAASPLYTLPNVMLTPHIAGSVGQECRRMGRYMVEELERYLAGKPLRWQVTPETASSSTHRPIASGTTRESSKILSHA